MSIESNRALVLKFYRLMSEQKFDEMFALMSDDAPGLSRGGPRLFIMRAYLRRHSGRKDFLNSSRYLRRWSRKSSVRLRRRIESSSKHEQHVWLGKDLSMTMNC